MAISLGLGTFPPAHAVAVDVDERFIDVVLVSIILHCFPAHRDVPVIDDAQAARSSTGRVA